MLKYKKINDNELSAVQFNETENATSENAASENAASGSATATEIIIPKNIGVYLVTEIADKLFEKNEEIKSVVLPDSIKRIGKCAFAQCKNLKTINLPNNIEVIDDAAFFECENLDLIFHTPLNLQKIGDYCFYGCKKLIGNLIFSETVLKIGSAAFKNTSASGYLFYNKDSISRGPNSRYPFEGLNLTVLKCKNDKTNEEELGELIVEKLKIILG